MSCLCSFETATTAAIQAEQGGAPEDERTVVLGTEVVLLDVSVTDAAGRPVAAIPKERFAVREDGQPQKITFFGYGQAPASIAMVLDASQSMKDRIERTASAAARLLDHRRPGDEFAVIEFRDTSRIVCDFTDQAAEVRRVLERLRVAGQTAVLDAAYLAADYAHRRGRNRLKAVVLVTDGLDKNSYYSFDDLVAHLRTLDVRLYVVGLTADLDAHGAFLAKSEKRKAEDLLSKLAADTGGKAFFPHSLDDLSSVDDAIAADVRSAYSIGYYPTNDRRDGTFRTLDVRVLDETGKPDPSLSVRTRTGYFAPVDAPTP